MIFIIEFYSTVVEFCRKLLTLYDNGKREKAGGGWIKCKSLPRFEGILHFIESLQFILVWLCCLSKSFWIYHNNQLLWIIQTHLKLPLNLRSWIKANFTVLFLLISSDMLDLFIIRTKNIWILVSCIYVNLDLFSNIHEKDWHAALECGIQSIRLSINWRIYMWFILSKMRCSTCNMESPSKASNKSRYTVSDIRLFQA